MRDNSTCTDDSLDERRHAAGLSMADLARIAGIPYQRLWRALTGGDGLTEDELAHLDAALGGEEGQR